MSKTSPAGANVYESTELPELGFRNYWYPVLAAWRLRRRLERFSPDLHHYFFDGGGSPHAPRAHDDDGKGDGQEG